MNTILLKKEMNLLQVQPLLELLIQIYLQLEEKKITQNILIRSIYSL